MAAQGNKRVGTSIIFLNPRREILLLLRDDKPEIECPGMWDLPGGHPEGDESPSDCIRREMQEEIGLLIQEISLFEIREFPDRLEYTYWVPADFDIGAIKLTEGQRLAWFSRERIGKITLAFGFNVTVDSFFSRAPFLSVP